MPEKVSMDQAMKKGRYACRIPALEGLVIEVEVVHPAGHTQQYFTHHRDVGEMVRIDRHLGIDTVWQRIDFGVRLQLNRACTPSVPGVTVSDCSAPCA
jgi:hypothetical protein